MGMALSMIDGMDIIRDELSGVYNHDVTSKIDIHIGLNSGPIVAGVCGNKSPRYKLFGDTVNTASRMESTCPYGKVQASPSTVSLFPEGVFITQERGEIKVKGKGVMKPYLVEGVCSAADKKHFVPSYLKRSQNYDNHDGHSFGASGSRARARSTFAHFENENLTDVISKRLDNLMLSPTSRNVDGLKRILTSKSSEDSNNQQHFYLQEGISRTGFAFGWRALWGKPYAPEICHRLSNRCTKKPSNDVIKAHSIMERQFFDEYQNQYLKSFRLATTFFILSILTLYIRDIQREIDYNEGYCAQEYGQEEYCKKSYGYDLNPSNPLCRWNPDLKICENSPNVTGNTCVWLVQDDVANKLARQRIEFFVLRFYIYLPIAVIVLLLTFHPKAKEHLAEDRCFGFKTAIPLFFYMYTGIATVFVSILGGNPGHFTLIVTITILLNTSYLRLYILIIWACAIAILYPILLYLIDFGYRRENYCYEPFIESIRVGQYVIYSVVTILPPIIVRETYLRSALFLKDEVDESNRAYEKENNQTTKMLLKLLPKTIVHELKKRKRKKIADYFDSVTIVFTDMKGFTAYSSRISPIELVGFLNRMYNRFDIITDRTNMYKVEIIGDAYYCVGGCPTPSTNHVIKGAETSLLMLTAIEDMKLEDPKLMEADVQIRIGVHTGPVIAAVVGVKDPRYHLFGDSVNYAMKMESNGVPGKVHCSESTCKAIRSYWAGQNAAITTFEVQDRGEIEIKGYSEKQKTYFINANSW